MRIPNAEEAFIPPSKLFDYLLSPSHPEGGAKAAFYEAVGYTKDNVDELEEQLLAIARDNDVDREFKFEFGEKYLIKGILQRKLGEGIPLLTIWVIDKGQTAPRFITAYPL